MTWRVSSELQASQRVAREDVADALLTIAKNPRTQVRIFFGDTWDVALRSPQK